MNKVKTFVASIAIASMAMPFCAWGDGNITSDMLQKYRQSISNEPSSRALRNAMAHSSIAELSTSISSLSAVNDDFTYTVPTKGITDQQSSGRCWLFTGMNVLRSKAISKFDLPELELSQVYLFFYDQLEKSNLFLQGIIDTRQKPMDDRMVDWLFSNPLSDGGTFTGVADLVMKYGVVPKDVMPETFSANHTSQISMLLKLKLREMGLELRDLSKNGKSIKTLQAKKEEMLGTIYNVLTLAYGIPPTDFTWSRRDKNGKIISTKSYTPQSFYKELWDGEDLYDNYIMVMNDPLREYYKVYRIDYDRHTYDGHDWLYLNLPTEEIKPMAIESIKDSTAMYFSCDVAKYLNRENGTLDLNNFDYESLLGIKFNMDKSQRVQTHASGSSHAMTMIAVDLNSATGKVNKWMVENSWGKNSGHNGKLIMTDKWFDEYMFRLVFNKKYVPAKYLEMMKQKPTLLPAWDPMFLNEE